MSTILDKKPRNAKLGTVIRTLYHTLLDEHLYTLDEGVDVGLSFSEIAER